VKKTGRHLMDPEGLYYEQGTTCPDEKRQGQWHDYREAVTSCSPGLRSYPGNREPTTIGPYPERVPTHRGTAWHSPTAVRGHGKPTRRSMAQPRWGSHNWVVNGIPG